MNLAWLLEQARLERPEHPAVIELGSDQVLSYSDLSRRTDQVAGALRDLGVVEESLVVTLMPDDGWHVATFFATLKLGAVFSGFNRVLTREKFAADIDRMGARHMIVSQEFLPTAEWLREQTCLETIIVSDGEPGGHPHLVSLATAHEGVRKVVPRREDDIACVNYTGGTSGVSKGVIFTHGTLGLSARMTIAANAITSADRNLSFISLYHSGGIHDAIVWASVRGTNILTGGWTADRFVNALERLRPTWIKAWVPTMVRDAMRHPKWDALDLTGISASMGGEPVPGELRDTLRSRGMRVTDTYGLTESMPWAVFSCPLAEGEEHLIPTGSCGRPMPEFCEVVLKDPETGAVITDPGVRGEVCIRGGVVSPGYFNDAQRTAASRDEDGFFHTRDVAEFDENGWFYMQGRVDDIINAGGEKISLVEIEDALKSSASIIDAACVGVPHDRFGTIPAAVVVAAHDIDDETLAAQLDEHCIKSIERWKRPRLYAVVAEVPRTLPKRTKNIPAIQALLADVRLADAEGVTTLSRHISRRAGA